MTLDAKIDKMEKLCMNYVPNRYLGDLLPASQTREAIRTYSEYLSRLTDNEAYGHLRHLGLSKKRASNFVQERNKLKGGKDE